MAGMQIPLDRDKAVPLARQIQAHLERLIAERLLAPGVKLPATRELAQSLGVNRATVALAYEELVAAGWARAHVGQGTFVSGPPDGVDAPAAPVATPPINWSGLLSRSARIVEADTERVRAMAPRVGGETLISFAGGMPDSGLFPTDAFPRAPRVRARRGRVAAAGYHRRGYPPLSALSRDVLLRFVPLCVARHLIVNGSSRSLSRGARRCSSRRRRCHEHPTHPGAYVFAPSELSW